MSDTIYLNKNQYIQILKNLKKHITIADFRAIDSDSGGDKFTTCSWGLCCDSRFVYDKVEYDLFPEKNFEDGTITPKYCSPELKCPHDNRDKPDLNGCFNHCIYKGLFNKPKRFSKQSRHMALSRVEKLIREKEKFNNVSYKNN